MSAASLALEVGLPVATALAGLAYARRSKASAPVCWIHVHPEYPHAGISLLGDGRAPVRPALEVKGLPLSEVKREFLGKVLKWDLLSASQRKALEAGERITLTAEGLRSII